MCVEQVHGVHALSVIAERVCASQSPVCPRGQRLTMTRPVPPLTLILRAILRTMAVRSGGGRSASSHHGQRTAVTWRHLRPSHRRGSLWRFTRARQSL